MATTTSPLPFADQLTPLLRSLRKRRGLTQAQLGELLGVSQARVAEIEANPGVVGIAAMLRLLSVLGAGLQLQVHDTPASGATDPLRTQDGKAQASAPMAAAEPKRGSW